MKMRKTIALLVAAVMTFGLVACGNGNKASNNNGEGEGSQYDWSAGADASGGDVTIKVATWRSSDKPYYEEIIKRFEEKYDWITVELDITGSSSAYYSNLTADLSSGTGPDVFDSHPGTKLNGYIDADLIAPQTDFDYMDNYTEDAKVMTQRNGENYAFMNAYNYFGFLYNKAAFEQVGATVPTTPEELIAAVNKLKQAGYGGIAYQGKTNGSAIADAIMMISLGNEDYNAMIESIDNGTLTDISEVEGVPEAFNTISDYIKNDIFYTSWEGIAYEAGMSLYAQQKSAIVYGGTYLFGEADTYFPDIDTGFFPIPTYAGTNLSYSEGAMNTCINAAGKNMGAAKLWVEFLATPEINEYYCSNARMLSTINGVTPEFEEAEMLANACTGYVALQSASYKNIAYWEAGYDSMLEAVLKGNEWKGLVKVYASKLEEYDLANVEY